MTFRPGHVRLAEFSDHVRTIERELAALLALKDDEPKGIAPTDTWLAYGRRVKEAYGDAPAMRAREDALRLEARMLGLTELSGFDLDRWCRGQELSASGLRNAHAAAVREACVDAGEYPPDEVLQEAAPRVWREVCERREAQARLEERRGRAKVMVALRAKLQTELDSGLWLWGREDATLRISMAGALVPLESRVRSLATGLGVARPDARGAGVFHLASGLVMCRLSLLDARCVVLALAKFHPELDWRRTEVEVRGDGRFKSALRLWVDLFQDGAWHEEYRAF